MYRYTYSAIHACFIDLFFAYTQEHAALHYIYYFYATHTCTHIHMCAYDKHVDWHISMFTSQC